MTRTSNQFVEALENRNLFSGTTSIDVPLESPTQTGSLAVPLDHAGSNDSGVDATQGAAKRRLDGTFFGSSGDTTIGNNYDIPAS